MKKALFGIAKSEDQAASIIDQFKVAGFSNSDIAALLPDRAVTRHFAHEQHTKAPEGAAVGAGIGVILGGAVGYLVGLGTLAIPGLGPLVVAGPIIAALAGAGVGAAVGFLTGTLIGVGMPEFEALQYDDKMNGGNILISVHTEGRTERERASGIFKDAGTVTAAEAVVEHAHGKAVPPVTVA